MADDSGTYDKPVRVNVLAKDVGAPNKELIEWLQGKGHDVKTHSNSVPPAVAHELVVAFKKGADAPSAEAEAPAAAAPKADAPAAEVRAEAPPAAPETPASEATSAEAGTVRKEPRTVRRVDTRAGGQRRTTSGRGRDDRSAVRRPPTPKEAREAREAQALRDGKRILRSAPPAAEPKPDDASPQTATATPSPRRPSDGPKRRISTIGGSTRDVSKGAPGEGGDDGPRRTAYSTRGEGRDNTRTYHSGRGRDSGESADGGGQGAGRAPSGGFAGAGQGSRRGQGARFGDASAPRQAGAGRGAAPRRGRGAPGPAVAPPRTDEETIRVQERRRLDKEREQARQELLELAEERHEEGALEDLLEQAARDDVSLPVRDEPIEIPEGSTIAVVAETLGVKASLLIGHMFQLGAMVTINDSLPMEVLEQLQEPFSFTAVKRQSVEDQLLQKVEIDREDTLVARAPVVTIMGHVDHGKTSLLDAVRKTNVADREAGSITQHIGAYDVKLENGRVVFLDTPGHEAFTAMRARGAHVTDVVVLVVAADDGVMPQTVEAINHARAAEVPIVVAVNKIDVPRANPDDVRTQLSSHALMPEDWGGSTVFQNVSAKTGEGIPELLEYLSLESELLELRANPDRNAAGTVVEAELSRGRGPVATVLVQNGTLRVGDYFVAGATSGRVRALIDDHGVRVQEAAPSTPVEVLGFNEVAGPGDQFLVLTEEDARALTRERQAEERARRLASQSRITLDDISRSIQQGQVKDLNVIIKADVEGSVEPLQTGVAQFDTDEVRVGVIHAGVGAISETDVMLAAASSAIIIGFQVGPTPEAVRAADREGVEIRTYDIIYNVTNEIRAALEGMLDPELSEQVLGRATVREVFRAPRFGAVAGSYVNNGRFLRGMKLRLLRDNRMVHEGVVDSLRRFREDVREVAAGFECGIAMGNFSDYQEGDVLECFTHEEVARTLEASASAAKEK